MDEEFSYIEPNQSYPSAFSSGSFNAAKGDEERSDSYEVAKRLQRKEGRAGSSCRVATQRPR